MFGAPGIHIPDSWALGTVTRLVTRLLTRPHGRLGSGAGVDAGVCDSGNYCPLLADAVPGTSPALDAPATSLGRA